MSRYLRELLSDEAGGLSSARSSFWLTLVVALGVIVADGLSSDITVPEPGYTLLGMIVGMVGVWAAGPRIAQYLGPALGSMVQGIGSSRRSPEPVRPEPDAETMRER